MFQALSHFAYYVTTYQDPNGYTYTTTWDGTLPGWFWGLFGTAMLIGLAIGIITVAGMWKVFAKAGKPGWASIVPIYNTIVLIQVAGRPTWWVFLYFASIVPVIGWFVALVTHVIVLNDIAKRFRQDVGMTLVLLFFPFIGFPVLGFGSYKYLRPKKAKA